MHTWEIGQEITLYNGTVIVLEGITARIKATNGRTVPMVLESGKVSKPAARAKVTIKSVNVEIVEPSQE